MALGTLPTILLVAGALLVGAVGASTIPQGHGGSGPAGPSSMDMGGMDMSQMDMSGMDMAGHDMPGHHMMTLQELTVPNDFHVDMPPNLHHDAPFPLEAGSMPSLSQAQDFAHKYSRLVAKEDAGIDQLRAEGYLTGKGVPTDPYVLEKFYITGDLSITSTNRSLILRDGYVAGQLRLDYNGESLYVHHVYAKDLRVNQNVVRDGPNTGGLFENNQFAFVGQIRHFVGEFRHNQVGPKPSDVLTDFLGDEGVQKVPAEVVFNFDGFHTADVHDNLFLGMVDMKLHGHNHGDCFTCPVHDHADLTDGGHENHTLPANDYGFKSIHSVRYTSLDFHDNEIRVPGGVALRYNDRNHAGDDRTAASEPNPKLNDDHVHFQDITIQRNKLVGGSLLVDVFNAADDHHTVQDRGILRIWDNDITVDYPTPAPNSKAPLLSGVTLQTSDGLELSLRGNDVRFVASDGDEPGKALQGAVSPKPDLRGIQLLGFDASNLTITKNIVEEGHFGVWASKLSAAVQWQLVSNDFRTQVAWQGQDVKNAPEEKP